jgi:flagellar basal-body rod protein FlgF
MRARMQSLEMLANNLANAETGGFKADREFYSLYVGDDASASDTTGDLQTVPVIKSQWTDLAQGNLRETANPLDFAIDGDGLFAIQTPGGVRYTRNGSFRVSPAGFLTASDGNSVRAQGGGQIALQPGLPVEVTADGAVTQGGQQVAQIEVAAFDHDSLNKVGLNYFAPPAGVQPRAANGKVLQGKLEESNVGAAESAVRLVAIMRQFEMLQKAMNIGSDFNKEAIEQVARVAS